MIYEHQIRWNFTNSPFYQNALTADRLGLGVHETRSASSAGEHVENAGHVGAQVFSCHCRAAVVTVMTIFTQCAMSRSSSIAYPLASEVEIAPAPSEVARLLASMVS